MTVLPDLLRASFPLPVHPISALFFSRRTFNSCLLVCVSISAPQSRISLPVYLLNRSDLMMMHVSVFVASRLLLPLLLILLLFLLPAWTVFTTATGPPNKRVRLSTTAAPSDPLSLYASRSHADWLALSHEALCLIATAHHIALAPHDALATTLFAHFSRPSSFSVSSAPPPSFSLVPPLPPSSASLPSPFAVSAVVSPSLAPPLVSCSLPSFSSSVLPSPVVSPLVSSSSSVSFAPVPSPPADSSTLSSLAALLSEIRRDHRSSMLGLQASLESIRSDQADTQARLASQDAVIAGLRAVSPSTAPLSSLGSFLSAPPPSSLAAVSPPVSSLSPFASLAPAAAPSPIFSDPPLRHDDSVYPVPPAPASVVAAVRAGRFVELSSFLPAVSAPGSSVSLRVRGDLCESDGLPSFDLVSRPSRSPIRTFRQWLSAFLSYASLYLRFFPAAAPGVFTYISHITRFAASFPFHQVVLYDHMFRRSLALYHPRTFWGAIDPDARELCFSASAIAAAAPAVSSPSVAAAAPSSSLSDPSRLCFTCSQPGHFANACPASRAASFLPSAPSVPSAPSMSFRPLLRASTRPFQPPRQSQFSFFQPPAPRSAICRSFQASGACFFPACRFAHACHCGGAHAPGACGTPPPS